jgi:actin-related protein
MTGRLREELAAVSKTLATTANVVSAPREQRGTCAWIGGSVLALLDEGVPDGMWVTREMYNEHGAAIIEEKCP